MRCACCDVLLTDFEATRKDKRNGRYLDLCNSCFVADPLVVPVVERADLFSSEDLRESGHSDHGSDVFIPYEDDVYVDDFNPEDRNNE